MNRLDRTARSAWTIAPLLACLALVAAPAAAMACAGRPHMARGPTRMVLATPSPNGGADPSPNDDQQKPSSTQKAPQSNGGNASSGGTSQTGQSGAASQQKQ